MTKQALYAGNRLLAFEQGKADGHYVNMEGQEFYKICGFDSMKPFFMSIVSDSDHWMFLSSNGALTAGRKNPSFALFPYYTVDKIHDSHDITGSKTIVRLTIEDKTYLWEPFSDRYKGVYKIERNLYKNICGNQVIFEEINHDLEVCFSYSWNNSEKFGFVRKSEIKNLGKSVIFIDLLDGIQNILPFGVDRNMQTDKSVLVDAYKKNELLAETGLGLYVLSSIPVDRAEPSEALKASTVWALGNNIDKRLVSSIQLDNFRQGYDIAQETDIRARRGAYFVNIRKQLVGNEATTWYIMAEVCQSSAKVASLNKLIKGNTNLRDQIEQDIAFGTLNLTKIVANADGLQVTNDKLTANRQFANVMFNVMRGGIFDNGYIISKDDFIRFVKQTNVKVFEKHEKMLCSMPESLHHTELKKFIEGSNDKALIRIGLEYMPLTFSRRHGDPSRPWNLFSIETRNEDGSKILNYQGNWRDIFQNWEALCYSYPGYVESMISKFVNASTADGYNPYRVTRDGFDWEIHDPGDPWSFIGYWGDHQIIYLLKFLELSEKFFPGTLQKLLTEEIFTYANVPYKIKSYEEILRHPQNSIEYDEKLEGVIANRVKSHGSDGKLVFDASGNIYYVNLTEKLLISALAKIANFIPEAGIWMNTQRPEWNDANNALVGYGVSMVTLCYLRRYVEFCRSIFGSLGETEIEVSEELLNFLYNVNKGFEQHTYLLSSAISDKDRKSLLDILGKAAEQYRSAIYTIGFANKKGIIKAGTLTHFFQLTLQYIDHSIKANKRADKLYHSYNIMTVSGNTEISITHLNEMLEGQVAVLNSGILSAKESLEVLQALKNSAMFWQKEYSYLLYPDRNLPRFADKNNIPAEAVQKSELIRMLIAAGNTSLVEVDIIGNCHFNGSFVNKNILAEALDKLVATSFAGIAQKEKQSILDLYESMFNHKSFTGRSGTFFGYEGLGCIYWHMVSKLLLVAEEVSVKAYNHGEKEVAKQLTEIYYDIRKGFGLNKTPGEYGAFPTDPYSHTPGQGGAQQPGMTGQVKEDIISRLGELGLSINHGCMDFNNLLLRKAEFLAEANHFSYYDVNGKQQHIALEKNSLAFTFCQVPIIYKAANKAGMMIYNGNTFKESDSLVVDQKTSQSIFERKGEISKIEVSINPGI